MTPCLLLCHYWEIKKFVCDFNSSIGSFGSHLTFSQSPVPYIISRPSRRHSNNSAISRANKQSQCMKRYLFLISPVRQTMHTELEKKKRRPDTSAEWRVMHAGQEWIILNHHDYRNKDEESSESSRCSGWANSAYSNSLPFHHFQLSNTPLSKWLILSLQKGRLSSGLYFTLAKGLLWANDFH